ncbi:MAG: type IV secretion system DNA-binding domain-containing protein, partial [Anaerolineae bacterium]|nr:type IV secretion system DNA-binding domain-containing protein [Anaerolineae bacterium]
IGGAALKVTQATDDRRRHMYIVGKTGAGKSTLMQNMALQDIESGNGVCVIDPHGELIDDILVRIPPYRRADVILFDPSDETRPIGLNLLEARSESEKHMIVNEFIGLLILMYDPHEQGIVGPRFQHNVRNAMLTAMSVEGNTLIEVVRALTDHAFVEQLLPHVTDPMVRNYWTQQIANTSDFHKSEILDYIVSKFSRFVGDGRVRNIIGQRHTTLDFRQIMDSRQILLVNLSKGKIGPENAQFLGLLLVQRLLLTALSRADMPPEMRPNFYLYVDEFQNFATEMFATVLSEGRKYGVSVTVANQYLTQLSPFIREAIFGNVGSIVSFRVGTQDAGALAPEYYPVFGPDDLLNLPKFTACVKLLVDGVATSPFVMRTTPDLREPDASHARAIREASRQTYGRDVTSTSEDIMKRFTARG